MTTTAIGASRVASERRSESEFVQSNECEANLPAWLEQAAKPDVKVDEQAYDDWLQNLDWRPR